MTEVVAICQWSKKYQRWVLYGVCHINNAVVFNHMWKRCKRRCRMVFSVPDRFVFGGFTSSKQIRSFVYKQQLNCAME